MYPGLIRQQLFHKQLSKGLGRTVQFGLQGLLGRTPASHPTRKLLVWFGRKRQGFVGPHRATAWEISYRASHLSATLSTANKFQALSHHMSQ